MSKFFTSILILVCIGSLGFGGYLYLSSLNNKQKISQNEQSINKQQEKLTLFQNEKNTQEKLRAKEIIDAVEANKIPWAKMLENTLKYEGSNIRFENFSAAKNNNVSISAKGKSLPSIARLLEDLKKDPHMEDPFIKGVSEGRITSDETLKYTFSLSFTFIENPS